MCRVPKETPTSSDSDSLSAGSLCESGMRHQHTILRYVVRIAAQLGFAAAATSA
jgi:hypothetical protein